jgi:hypothetical protein
MIKFRQLPFMLFLLVTASSGALADGLAIDKVYHPYVDALESEVEYRLLAPKNETSLNWPRQIHQLSLGRSFGQRWFGEIYLKGEKNRGESFNIEAVELEFKKQLTEQGEYSFDAGLLLEYENEYEDDVQEISAALLLEREIGQWSLAANLFGIYEWGDELSDEFETALAVQARFRSSREFEPGMEFYAGQDTLGIGPVIQGTVSTGVRKSLHWEAGVIIGLKDETPDHTVRLLLEYEF